MNSKKTPKVFVIILTYNGMEFIGRCLKSVFALSYPNVSVVVVDNNSSDGSLEFAKNNFSRAFFIKNDTNLGFASGMNVGIRFALERMADYVVLLNQDTEVEPDFLEKLVTIGEKEEKIGILSPVIFENNGDKIWFSGGDVDWLEMKVVHNRNSFAKKYKESIFISGCSMLVKRQVFKRIGLLDEDFFLYYEDADFSLRSIRGGFKNVVVSDSWIYHLEASQREKENKNKLYWLVLSGIIFFLKNASFWQKIWIKTYIFLRKIKNIKDIVLKINIEKAKIIRKAFKDYKNVT